MKLITKIFCLSLSSLLVASLFTDAQVSFTNTNSQLQGVTHSGCSITVVDVNGDGLDDIVRLDEGHIVYVDYQRPGHQFDHVLVADFGYSSGWAWGMCVADVDHNGFKDVVAGGGGPSVKLLLLNSTGTGGTIVALPSSGFFLQNVNFMDVNNDGWEDIFGCDDNDESHIWVNDGTGDFSVSTIIDFDVTTTDDSGNYGSVWSDFDNDGDVDFYIAKCRQGVNDPGDGRRIDVLFVNDGNSNYTSDAATYGLADSGETWTCNFADIDNDGDLDAIQVDQDVPAKLLENDGTGHMTNITTGSGFDVSDLYPLESVMEDFDNDGFVDIFVTGGYGDPDFFHNNGDHTFTQVNGLFDVNQIESFAIGDLNHDGKIDVYAGYADVYTSPSGIDDVYWLNTTVNGNHFITFNLIGTTSSVGAYGARVTLYGSWGTQVREVHAGESYGTCNSTNLHFGLGTATSIDSAIVHWPSGINTTIINPAVDQFMTVKENTCVSPDFSISTPDPLIFCTGQAVLTASSLPAGYSYLWNNDSTTQSINAVSTGDFYCTAVSANDACSVTSLPISLVVNPPSIPTITVSGDLTFCDGGSVTLISSSGASYDWSTGESTQSINATAAGYYTVATPGMCQAWTSDPIYVNVLSAPAPVTTGDYLGAPGQATVTATGNTVSWYDVPAGGSPVATGNSYTTYVSATDTFYAEDQEVYGADSLYGGQIYHEGGLYSGSTTNNTIIFDVFNPCKLKSVKVYTDHPGDRLIELRNSNGNTIQSVMVNVPLDSSRITLNFDLTPGTGYELGTNTAQNNILLGTASPRLERSDDGLNYPYVIDNLVSMTGYSGGTDRYYYFYDWEVMKIPLICISDRTPAVVDVTTGIQNANASATFELFPNPTEGLVTIKSDETTGGKVSLQVVDVTGKELLSRIDDDMKQGKEIQLDLSQLPKGIYFLNIESGANTLQHKVVIQ